MLFLLWNDSTDFNKIPCLMYIFSCVFFYYFPVIGHIEWPFIQKPHFVQQDLAPPGLSWAEQWGPTHTGLCYWIWLQDLGLTNYRPVRSVEQGVSQPTLCSVGDEGQWWAHEFVVHLILHKLVFLWTILYQKQTTVQNSYMSKYGALNYLLF